MPDIVLDYHRLKTPIDHPDLSITRGKLEYPTVNVSFAYLAVINKVRYGGFSTSGYVVLTSDRFTDRAVWVATQVNAFAIVVGRYQDFRNTYYSQYNPAANRADHVLIRLSGGAVATIATEAIDIDNRGRGLAISCSGSAIKSLRYEMTTATDPLNLPNPSGTISATDTTFTTGHYGFRFLREVAAHGGTESGSAWLKAPLTPLARAQAVLELDVEGDGRDDPYRPSLSKKLVDIDSLTGLPDFLYIESKKYRIFRNRGFTDEEIQMLLGYIPQHQIDLDAVTWGAFEFRPDRAPTVVVTVVGDAYAVARQKSKARGVFKAPKDYGNAVALYKRLSKEHSYWLAGKDNFAYQVLGWEVFDWFQNVDFYYGELVEHRTHYDQIKQVPEHVLWRRLDELETSLQRISGLAGALAGERNDHLNKVKEIKKRGW